MGCVSCTQHLQVKSKEIFANFHKYLNNKITVARTGLMICQLFSQLSPNKNNDNICVFTFLGAR